MPAVETQQLTKEYGAVHALDGLDLTIERGELYGLLGPNGSGKTTTIEILTGQRVPTSGEVSVLDIDPVENPLDVRRAVGILPEREDPPSFLTPREYLQFVGDVRDIADVDARIEEWSTKLEFRGILDTLSTDLSEGERQRVMLAQVFIHEPELVFIDEPLVNLDPLMQAEVRDILTAYCEAGNTLFLSTHFMEVAEDLCSRVGIIADGKLVTERDPQSLDEDGLLETFATELGGESAVEAGRP
ncbi:ABC-2 type transport system ATP-binding protein [Halovenus aranensis]|jgi:ABC-2 type transport system ATP-binding protein|uniref:ABC-2 type transport system ATP-binding protein n=1 Tax=Halovenus aranensis TaxID=890420 RepID=A0A1G8UCW3_9EURY|nr:ABC transporter ATP-binding protein [Halovenus aranensis]SDJ51015.1 ABC-2 type transport system ATP-binding protein [Halovenus aranensis]